MNAKNQVDALRDAKGAATTRVSGHELQWEGAPHDAAGKRLGDARMYGGRSGDGRAKCFCGKLSGVLPSAAARKAWHRQHKLDVIASRRSVAAGLSVTPDPKNSGEGEQQ